MTTSTSINDRKDKMEEIQKSMEDCSLSKEISCSKNNFQRKEILIENLREKCFSKNLENGAITDQQYKSVSQSSEKEENMMNEGPILLWGSTKQNLIQTKYELTSTKSKLEHRTFCDETSDNGGYYSKDFK
jgi:hypothetical protein